MNELPNKLLRVEDHMPLVKNLAKRFRRKHIPFEDLVSAGCIGLLEASLRFEEGRGARFGTYAYWRILYCIQTQVTHAKRMVPLPDSRVMRKARRHLPQVRRALEQKYGRVSQQQLANALSIPVDAVVRAQADRINYDVPLKAEHPDLGVVVRSVVPDPESSFQNRESKDLQRRLLCLALRSLNKRERTIVYHCYWRSHKYTLKKMAARYHISYERVRQLRNQSLRKMRCALERQDTSISELFSSMQN